MQDHAHVPLSVTRSPVSPAVQKWARSWHGWTITALYPPMAKWQPAPGTTPSPLHPDTLGQALGTGGPATERSPGLGWEVGTGGSDPWDPAAGVTVTP